MLGGKRSRIWGAVFGFRDTFFVNRIINISGYTFALIIDDFRVFRARNTARRSLNLVIFAVFHAFFPLGFVEISIFTNTSCSIRA